MGGSPGTDCADFSTPCILGIDEAGRGPVLGPMVYAAAYCPKSHIKALHALGADDSKQLTAAQRDVLLEKIKGAPFLRTVITPLSAESLSNKMLQRRKYNLNLISHDTALDLVQSALDAGANVTEVYVDTVGSPEKYADKFRQRFPFLAKVDVRKKADSVFRIVGAASIVAKTFRDKVITEWEFEEDVGLSHNVGSGYPGDPMTKKWLAGSVDRVFGFPNFVRFSWGTARTILEKDAVDVEWESNDEEDARDSAEPVRKTRDITSFFGKKSGGTAGATGKIGKVGKRRKTAQKMPKCISKLGVQRAIFLL